MFKSDFSTSELKSRAAKLADKTEAALSTLADVVRARAEDIADSTGASAEKAYDQARDQMRGAASNLASRIEDRPLLTVFAVGLMCAAAGFLMAKRPRSS